MISSLGKIKEKGYDMKLIYPEKYCVRVIIYSMFIILLFGFTLPLSAESFSFSISGIEIKTDLKSPEELRFKGIVKQKEDISGGGAALATVFKYYYDDPVTEKDILDISEKLSGIRLNNQSSLLELKKIAEEKNYKVYGLQVTMEGLNRLKLPGILLLDYPNYPHFVVIRGVMNNNVVLADPVMGNLTIEREKFKTMWNNIVIAIESKKRAVTSINLKQFVRPSAPSINCIDDFLDREIPYFLEVNSNEF